MLSIFPALLNYSFIAPFILRLTLGGILIYQTEKNFRGLVGALAGLLILLGLYTQVAAMVVIVTTLVSQQSKEQRILMIAIALSLLLSGAGFKAFDLPL